MVDNYSQFDKHIDTKYTVYIVIHYAQCDKLYFPVHRYEEHMWLQILNIRYLIPGDKEL